MNIPVYIGQIEINPGRCWYSSPCFDEFKLIEPIKTVLIASHFNSFPQKIEVQIKQTIETTAVTRALKQEHKPLTIVKSQTATANKNKPKKKAKGKK